MESQSTDYFKYKSIVFIVFVATIAFALLGVTFFRDAYFFLTIFILSYIILKYMQMIFVLLYANYKFSKSMDSFRKRQLEKYSSSKQITQVFVVPSYCEEDETLRNTLRNFASHSRARDYCVFLAMQKHEVASGEQAQRLVEEFAHKFRLMSFTRHELAAGETKTKSSNINYCVRHMVPKLLENHVDMDTVFITIMDSDSQIPEAYVDQMEQHIQSNYKSRHIYIYQPPQIFAQNERETSFFVRVMDNLMSAMQCSQLFSIFNFTIAVSNYTMSYRLLERVGFWDTCKYSKCEDMRMTTKSIWKTNGEAKTCPIYIPINQMSLATHQGYWADFKGRLQQSQKHCQDQVEMSYNFVNSGKSSSISLIKRLYICFTVIEVYLLPLVGPITIIISALQQNVKILPMSQYDDGTALNIFNTFGVSTLIIIFVLFQHMKRRATRQLYGGQPISCIHAFLIPFLQLPIIFVFGLMPMIIASFNMLTDDITTKVTTKRSLKSTKSIESMLSSEVSSNTNMETDDQNNKLAGEKQICVNNENIEATTA